MELRARDRTASRVFGVVFKVGDLIASRYRVTDIIGSGGAGVVYRARDRELDVEVALKVINAKLVQTPDEQRLFSRQTRIAKKLCHQNVARIFDEGRDEDRPFYTLQFLEGLSLRKIIDLRREKNQTFELGEIEPIYNQLCQALDYAHRTTFHGALKPDNVIVLPDLLKVTDFALLRGLPRKPFLAIQKSRAHNFRYLAPEVRLEVSEIDHQVDVYSLGVILGEMLVGVVHDDAKPDQLDAATGLDPRLLSVVKRAIARSPRERYGSAGELYDDFRSVVVKLQPRLGAAAVAPHHAEAPTQRLDVSRHGPRPTPSEPAELAEPAADDALEVFGPPLGVPTSAQRPRPLEGRAPTAEAVAGAAALGGVTEDAGRSLAASEGTHEPSGTFATIDDEMIEASAPSGQAVAVDPAERDRGGRPRQRAEAPFAHDASTKLAMEPVEADEDETVALEDFLPLPAPEAEMEGRHGSEVEAPVPWGVRGGVGRGGPDPDVLDGPEEISSSAIHLIGDPRATGRIRLDGRGTPRPERTATSDLGSHLRLRDSAEPRPGGTLNPTQQPVPLPDSAVPAPAFALVEPPPHGPGGPSWPQGRWLGRAPQVEPALAVSDVEAPHDVLLQAGISGASLRVPPAHLAAVRSTPVATDAAILAPDAARNTARFQAVDPGPGDARDGDEERGSGEAGESGELQGAARWADAQVQGGAVADDAEGAGWGGLDGARLRAHQGGSESAEPDLRAGRDRGPGPASWLGDPPGILGAAEDLSEWRDASSGGEIIARVPDAGWDSGSGEARGASPAPDAGAAASAGANGAGRSGASWPPGESHQEPSGEAETIAAVGLPGRDDLVLETAGASADLGTVQVRPAGARKRPMTRPRMPTSPSWAPEDAGRAIDPLFDVPSAPQRAGPPTGAHPLVVEQGAIRSVTEEPAATKLAPPTRPAAGVSMRALTATVVISVIALLVVLVVVVKVQADRQAAQTAEIGVLAHQVEDMKRLSELAREREREARDEALQAQSAAKAAATAQAEAGRLADAAKEKRARAEADARARESDARRLTEEARGAHDDQKRAEVERAALQAQDVANRRRQEAEAEAQRERDARDREARERQRHDHEEQLRQAAERRADAEHAAQAQAEASAQNRRLEDNAELGGPGASPPVAAAGRAGDPGPGSGGASRGMGDASGGPGTGPAAGTAVASLVPAAVGKACPKGMALVDGGSFVVGAVQDDPDRNFGDLAAQPVDVPAFCIDYYEFPNGRGRTPDVGVTFKDAQQECARKGKRLCSESEWEKACKGPGGTKFPYGNAWDGSACATEDETGTKRDLAKSGDFKRCHSGYNVFDMSGNVAEWTATEYGAGGYVVKGGAADRPGYDARCAARRKKKALEGEPMLGFRCCADPS